MLPFIQWFSRCVIIPSAKKRFEFCSQNLIKYPKDKATSNNRALSDCILSRAPQYGCINIASFEIWDQNNSFIIIWQILIERYNSSCFLWEEVASISEGSYCVTKFYFY